MPMVSTFGALDSVAALPRAGSGAPEPLGASLGPAAGAQAVSAITTAIKAEPAVFQEAIGSPPNSHPGAERRIRPGWVGRILRLRPQDDTSSSIRRSASLACPGRGTGPPGGA